VERSHRTDDEAFYRPYLLQAHNVRQFLQLSARWVYIYNVLRPRSGVGMDHQPPLAVLQRLGYTGDERIALFPPVLLDAISTDLLLSCCPETGNDLLAHYSISVWEQIGTAARGRFFTAESAETTEVFSYFSLHARRECLLCAHAWLGLTALLTKNEMHSGSPKLASQARGD